MELLADRNFSSIFSLFHFTNRTEAEKMLDYLENVVFARIHGHRKSVTLIKRVCRTVHINMHAFLSKTTKNTES